MSVHKEIQKRVNKEQSALEEDRRKVIEAQQALQAAKSTVERREAYINGLLEALKLVSVEPVAKTVIRNLRPNSLMAKAREAILAAGQPLYIDDIAEALGDPAVRTSLAGSLRSYAKKQEIFTLTGPNTFGLIELPSESEENATHEEEFFDPFADE